MMKKLFIALLLVGGMTQAMAPKAEPITIINNTPYKYFTIVTSIIKPESLWTEEEKKELGGRLHAMGPIDQKQVEIPSNSAKTVNMLRNIYLEVIAYPKGYSDYKTWKLGAISFENVKLGSKITLSISEDPDDATKLIIKMLKTSK